MSKANLLATAASLAAVFAAAPGFAQADFTGASDLQTRLDEIENEADTQFARSEDVNRFGLNSYGPGLTGSVSLAGTVNTGTVDSTDFLLGAQVYQSIGEWNQTLGLAFEYGEAEDVEFEKRIFAIYDVNRSLTDRVYLFALGRGEYDEFSAFRRSAFAGAGAGYRLFNQPDIAWRLQAGPGVRYTETGFGDEQTDLAGIASSFFFYRLRDGVFVDNDTNVIYSDTSTLISNDLGLTVRLTDVLSTRLGYRVDYETEAIGEFDNTDQNITAALVYTFR
jgi:putative salt-induced outer membrane protein